jgi:hypothetical protein
MESKMKWAWLGVIALMLLSASLLIQPAPVLAQSTATATATSTATNTPTPTATPIATALPMAQSITGYAQGVRVGQYGIVFSTSGSAFQAFDGNSIDLYNALGRHTVSIDGATGNIKAYGTLAIGTAGDVMSGTVKFGAATNYTSGATITHGFASAPTSCVVTPNAVISATIGTLGTTTFTVTTSANAATIFWFCGK